MSANLRTHKQTRTIQGSARSSAERAQFYLLAIIAFFSYGALNYELLSETTQQIVIVLLWSLVAINSVLSIPRWGGAVKYNYALVPIYAFFVFCGFSVFWSDVNYEVIMKVVIMFTIFFAISVSATRIKPALYIRSTLLGLITALVVSIFLVGLLPDIGRMTGWQHEGKWAGIYAQKQLLGAVAATVFYYSMAQFTLSKRSSHLIMAGLALACVFGSESRSALILSGLAVLLTVSAVKFAAIRAVLAYWPAAFVIIIGASIATLAISGANVITLHGEEVTLNGRTVIWHHALQSWIENPIWGVGYNGFWSMGKNVDSFWNANGWVLNNYHNGYVATLVELGLVGYSIFLGLTMYVCRKVNHALKYGQAESILLAGFLVLFFTLNITETFLMRTTNGFFTGYLFVVCAFAGGMFDEYKRKQSIEQSGHPYASSMYAR